MRIVIFGLSITSSWGNGHATTYRALVRELTARGHDVLFLERDVPWYRSHRDLPEPPYGRTLLYESLEEMKDRFKGAVERADVVIVGSFVPEGVQVGRWVQDTAAVPAFYDIDTPVTLAKLERGDYEYIHPRLIPGYELYLSFTGGPTLKKLEDTFGSPRARPLYCSVDPELYHPENTEKRWDLGYLGTYSDDRQPPLEHLMFDAARAWKDGRFVVAGPGYPDSVVWPPNLEHIDHLSPEHHRRFYNSQRFTMNITRADMVRAGYAPSVRLFEAAACGVPVISDYWEGLEYFFELEQQILVTTSAEQTLQYLAELSSGQAREIGRNARRRVLAEHTAAHRAEELECYLREVLNTKKTASISE